MPRSLADGPPGYGHNARLWLVAGTAACLISFGFYGYLWLTSPSSVMMSGIDLRVYRLGGLIALHMKPPYDALRSSPLYDWPGFLGLKFTYPPFAAVTFSPLGLARLSAWLKLSVLVNVAMLAATIWFTLGGLGQKAGAARAGRTALLASVLLWSEPVQRVLWLGQIELILMALVMWDLCQPDGRTWKGAGVGLAAGIKLVPLLFIPYLLLTRRYRQAGVAAGAFAVTVVIGFLAMPADSAQWWFGGVFLRGDRTGFVGWEGNQSLAGIITRFAGSVAGGAPGWIAAAALTLVIGMTVAVIMDRAGNPVAGILATALTATLISPISWDHHWVWVVPGVTALAARAARASGAARWSLVAVAGVTAGLFTTVPGTVTYQRSLIWRSPFTDIKYYFALGDRRWFPEYHWHGAQLLAGNAFILTGLALFALLIGLAIREVIRARRTGRPLLAAAPDAERVHPITAS